MTTKKIEVDKNKKKEGMKIRPLKDRIVIDPFTEDPIRKGDIKIADNAVIYEGTVKAVDGLKNSVDIVRTLSLSDLKVGDKILYSKYGGTEITVDGEDFLLMTEEDEARIVDREQTDDENQENLAEVEKSHYVEPKGETSEAKKEVTQSTKSSALEPSQLGARIRDKVLGNPKKMTIVEAADILGRHHSRLTNIFNNITPLTPYIASLLEEKFNIDLEEEVGMYAKFQLQKQREKRKIKNSASSKTQPTKIPENSKK